MGQSAPRKRHPHASSKPDSVEFQIVDDPLQNLALLTQYSASAQLAILSATCASSPLYSWSPLTIIAVVIFGELPANS